MYICISLSFSDSGNTQSMGRSCPTYWVCHSTVASIICVVDTILARPSSRRQWWRGGAALRTLGTNKNFQIKRENTNFAWKYVIFFFSPFFFSFFYSTEYEKSRMTLWVSRKSNRAKFQTSPANGVSNLQCVKGRLLVSSTPLFFPLLYIFVAFSLPLSAYRFHRVLRFNDRKLGGEKWQNQLRFYICIYRSWICKYISVYVCGMQVWALATHQRNIRGHYFGARNKKHDFQLTPHLNIYICNPTHPPTYLP